jgi:hypothetical protein
VGAVDGREVQLVQLVAAIDQVVVRDRGLERERAAHPSSLGDVYGTINTFVYGVLHTLKHDDECARSQGEQQGRRDQQCPSTRPASHRIGPRESRAAVLGGVVVHGDQPATAHGRRPPRGTRRMRRDRGIPKALLVLVWPMRHNVAQSHVVFLHGPPARSPLGKAKLEP